MRVRDDDVGVLGSRFKTEEKALNRLKSVHKMIVDEAAVHVASIVCNDLLFLPKMIEFMREAVVLGELIPEIHGKHHIDYGDLSELEIVEHLKWCIDFIQTKFDYCPTKFYVPWAVSTSCIDEASNIVGLEVVGVSRLIKPIRKIFTGKLWPEKCVEIREERSELWIHWWDWRLINTVGELADSYSLVNTLRTVRNDDPSFFPQPHQYKGVRNDWKRSSR